MLQGFTKIIVDTYDPDIITGYNIMNFDNVYLIKRLQQFCPKCRENQEKIEYCVACTKTKHCPEHRFMSCSNGTCRKARRISRINKPTTIRAIYKESNQKGGHETYDEFLVGREWMDLYDVIKNDHKVRSFKLDEVAKHFEPKKYIFDTKIYLKCKRQKKEEPSLLFIVSKIHILCTN